MTRTWITNARIRETGGHYRPRAAIAVEGEVIAAVADQSADWRLPEGDREIDAGGATLLPGFIDCHVHACWSGEADLYGAIRGKSEGYVTAVMLRNAALSLAAGFTTLCDLGAPGNAAFEARAALRDGVALGSRLSVSGQPLAMTGGHAWFISWEVDGVDEVTKASRQLLKQGADCLKVIATGGVNSPNMATTSSQLSREEMAAAVTEARRQGRRVTIHGIGTEGIRAALDAGVHCVEHGVYLTDELIGRMLEAGVFLVPTLSALDAMLEEPHCRSLPPYALAKARRSLDSHRDSARRAIERGVRVAFGTDAGTPFNRHGGNIRELRLLMEAGMSFEACIDAATETAAACLGLEGQAGRIAPGAFADIIGFRQPALTPDILAAGPDFLMFRGDLLRRPGVSFGGSFDMVPQEVSA